MEMQTVYSEQCPDRIYDRHCHTHYEIIYVLGGSVTVNLEGSHYFLEEGSFLVIEPLRYHIVTGNNTLYHRLLVDFTRSEIPEDLYEKFDRRMRLQPVFSSGALSGCFEQLYHVHKDYADAHLPLLNAVFVQALYMLSFTEVIRQTAPEERKGKLLQAVISYVDENMSKTISLRELGEYLFVSESTLCHMFKEEMKISLKQYILRKKMMYAKSLILAGTTPGEAATACGYKNYASFYKVFLKFTGQAPSVISFAKKEM